MPNQNPYQEQQTKDIIAHIVDARDGDVEVLNLRFDRHAAPDFVKTHQNFFPAYHMNKDNWYSILLDGGLENSAIFALIAKSFELVNT